MVQLSNLARCFRIQTECRSKLVSANHEDVFSGIDQLHRFVGSILDFPEDHGGRINAQEHKTGTRNTGTTEHGNTKGLKKKINKRE